jgi:hypothetical protein
MSTNQRVRGRRTSGSSQQGRCGLAALRLRGFKELGGGAWPLTLVRLVPVLFFNFTIGVGIPRQTFGFLRVSKLNCIVHSLLVLLVLRIRR